MSFITSNDLKHLLTPVEGDVCVSLYQATHMTYPDTEKDPIQFKDLLKKLEIELSAHMKGREYKPILQAFADFQENQEFWRHRTPGLAMFYHGGHLHTFEVPRAVPNQVIVADSFHLKPIFRVLQTTDRFNILTLDRNTAHAFEANRDSIMPVNLSDMPIHKKEHDKGARTRVGEQHMSGFGRSVIAIHDVDEKAEDSGFFHEVDRFVEENLSKQTHLPLVLVAVSEHQGTFRKVAKNHLLLADGVTTGPSSLDLKELRDKAFAVVEKHQHAFIRKQIDAVEAGRAHEKASTDLSDIARAAVAGRVGTLLVDADLIIPGRMDASTGEITHSELSHPEVDDVLDDLLEAVFKADGTIYVLPKELMPLDSGVAALYRF